MGARSTHGGLLSFLFLSQRCHTQAQLCIPAFPSLWKLSALPCSCSCCVSTFTNPQVCPGASSSLPQPSCSSGPEQGLGSKVGEKLNKCLNITQQELRGVYRQLSCLPTPSSSSSTPPPCPGSSLPPPSCAGDKDRGQLGQGCVPGLSQSS